MTKTKRRFCAVAVYAREENSYSQAHSDLANTRAFAIKFYLENGRAVAYRDAIGCGPTAASMRATLSGNYAQ